jgi:hypothetical protein
MSREGIIMAGLKDTCATRACGDIEKVIAKY